MGVLFCLIVGFDGNTAWTLPRGHRALCCKYQIVDLSRRSPSYEYRLCKYSQRGYVCLCAAMHDVL